MSVVLALYPNARGLGYACVELPQRLLDWGIVTVKPASNERVMERVGRYLEHYAPEVVFVRDPARPDSRVSALVGEIEENARARGLEVHRYSREQVREAFALQGARTKHEISRKVAGWFPELDAYIPRLRKPYMDEDYRMGVFDALSLLSAHLYLKE